MLYQLSYARIRQTVLPHARAGLKWLAERAAAIGLQCVSAQSMASSTLSGCSQGTKWFIPGTRST